MTEQALGKRAVETLDNGLVSVNLSAAAADVRLVGFHFFGYDSHKLAARVDLQHLGPSQRTAPVNRLEGLRHLSRIFRGQRLSFFVTAGDVDNGQRVLVDLPPVRQLVMGQKKKVRLVDRVGHRHVEFRTRNVSRRRQVNLPEGLPDQPHFGGIFGNLAASANFLMVAVPFQ